MAEFHAKRKALFPQSASIASLSDQQQMTLIRSMETSSFFEVLRTHTVLGFLGDPKYGGNRGKAGWRQIGFEDAMVFEHPFGYYDVAGKP
jgi:gluconate 2-dehydrogenase gamma chain